MASSRDIRDWYQKKRWIFLWLVFFPPLGLIILWLKRWPIWAKIAGTSIPAILLIMSSGGTEGEQVQVSTSLIAPESVVPIQTSEANSSTSISETEIEPTPASFQNAVKHATEAVSLGRDAATIAEWESAAQQWGRAIESLEQVPESSNYFQTAQNKIEEYSANSEYTQQRIEGIRQDALVSERQRQQQQAAASVPQPGSPIRSSVSGSCDCPYDRDSAGRSCGGRSAYSRPGGASSICYVGE
ncbi:MAG: hypothetical protein AAGA75_28770 [Cyanobacteria bacterium P01_E01_bin.6]